MKLGVHIGYWGLGLTSQDQLNIVQEAERLGYDSVWTAEAYGSDTATVLAWLAGQTSTIRLGSGIFQMPGRSPAMTAMTAATIDQLSDGRMILGIGSSGPQVAEGWHGQRFAQQLQRTREYVAVVRMALARERVEFHGETLELPLPDGPGRALKLTIPPVQERIPIYLAAIGPKNTALAGEIADGWIPTLFSPEHVSELQAPAGGRRRALGRIARGLRHRADRQRLRHRRPRGRAQRDAPLRRAVRRRHGLAQAELLQQPRAALRLRGRGQDDPGLLSGRQARGGHGSDPRQADRHGLAVRPQGRRARAPRRLPRRRRGHARDHPDRLHRARSASTQLRLVAELAA